MKSKKKQRLLALILSMVLMLSASISAMAEGEVPTEASGTETTETQAAAQSLGEEVALETEVQTEAARIDAQSAETLEEPVLETTETSGEITEPVQEVTGETTETEVPTTEETTGEETQNVEEELGEIATAEEQLAETPEETLPEETVVSEAAELKQEFTDENGNVTQTITAYVPEGAFQATADQISMEVTLLNTDDTNYIKGMMEELIPENNYLDGYVLYQIDFKVNGEITKPAKAITITMTGNELAVEDTQKAHVFYYNSEDPEIEGDKDQLIEVIQKEQLIKSLEESGQSTENIEDYDYSEIAVNKGNADAITVKGWESTIYGCYVEKEAVTELSYEDDSVTVTVSADQAGIIPENAELSVTPITKTEITDDMSEEEKAQAEEINAQYDLTEEKLQKDSEENDTTMEGFLAYDICFLVDGEEVEPSGDIRVVMDFKAAAAPEGVSMDAEVTVKHLKADESAENGITVEDMTEAASLETTEKAEIQRVELVTESFSIFTVQWQNTNKRFDVQVVDASGESIGKENGNASYEFAGQKPVSVDKIASDIKKEYDIDLNFNKAIYVNDGGNNAFSFSGMQVYGFLNKNDSTGFWYCNEENINGTGGWAEIGGGTIYFVFGEKTAGEPSEPVSTVSTRDENITINLFDYQVGADGAETVNLNGDDPDGLRESGINEDHILKFVSSKGSGNKNINIWQQGSSGYLNSDMVLPTLDSNGFPVLNPNKPGSRVNETLDYLFNTEPIPNAKAVYKNLDGLFKKDGNGYYYYDSDEYYAYLEKAGDGFSNEFKAVSKKDVGFYPFTIPTDENIRDIREANDDAVLGHTDVNHYFGMTITADFIQPRDGEIAPASGSGTNEDMIFHFSGDDDVWVFIDDVLVLDLGGIHAAVSGDINFSTGQVTMTDVDKISTSTNIAEMFKEAGKYSEENFEGNTFSDYSQHNIKFFYLERGNSDSNCEIRFNFPTIPSDSVVVSKEVVDENEGTLNYTQDIDFEFNLKKYKESSDDSENLFSNYANEEYILLDSSGTEIQPPEGTDSYKTDKNGNFTLKAGQMAVFPDFLETDQYIVTEIGAYLNGYDVSDSISEQKLEIIQIEGEEGETIYGATTGELTVGDTESVEFTNTVKNRTTLSITKRLPDNYKWNLDENFEITVWIQGSEYQGTYTVIEENSESSGTTDDGTIPIRPGQTIQITGLPYGTNFEVEETKTLGYAPVYLVSGSCYDVRTPSYGDTGIITGDVTSVSGTVNGDGESSTADIANVNITNYPTSVHVTKQWAGVTPPEGYLVKIQLLQNGNPYPMDSPQTIILGKDDNWTGTFSELPSCYFDEESQSYVAYQYSVQEIAVGTSDEMEQAGYSDMKGYKFEVTGDAVNGFIITNTLSEIEIDIQKFGSEYGTDNNPNYQEGAVFQLFTQATDSETGEKEWVSVSDNLDVKNTESKPELSLEPGLYYLEEKAAPAGFQLLNKKIYFRVSVDGVVLTDADGKEIEGADMWRIVNDGDVPIIQIRNKALYDLPSAGGSGIFLYMIGGTLLLMAGSLMIYINKRRGVLRR